MGDPAKRPRILRGTLTIAVIAGIAGLGYGIVSAWRLLHVGEATVSGMSAADARRLWAKHHDEWDELLVDLRIDPVRETEVRDRLRAAGMLDVHYDRRTGVLTATLWQCQSLAGCRRGFLEWLPIEESERRKATSSMGRSSSEIDQLDAHWWLRFD
jgi:hypothetical protein